MFVHERLDPNERFRERRAHHRRRRRRRRTTVLALLLLAGGSVPVAVFVVGDGGSRAAGHVAGPGTIERAAGRRPAATSGVAEPTPLPKLPAEIRGVHVTMSLASLPGRIQQYMGLRSDGLNTIELDVKDESGRVGFVSRSAPEAQAVGAARPFYDPVAIARDAHELGVYLIGRVVVFEDPVLAKARPQHALRFADGRLWTNAAGLGWVSEYDPAVWKYAVDVAEGAARAGFDEIQFDYVRFPSDGDVSSIVYPQRRVEPKQATVRRFLQYAVGRLRPLHVRISADLFGLAATRDLRIGQAPAAIGKVVDAIYPMVYPSHFNAGEYNLADPEAQPYETVGLALADFRRVLRASSATARITPWVQDFSLRRTYTLIDVRRQIEAARAAHASGYLLWNPRGVYTTEALQAP